jgi:preprotein translocase subunit Sec61beta
VRPGERRTYMDDPQIVLAIALLIAMLVIDRLAR